MRGMGFHAIFKERDDMQISINDKCWGWKESFVVKSSVNFTKCVITLYV
jgi:hypothetical protein